MQRKVTKLKDSHVQVDVVVDEKTWTEAQAKAFKKEASNVTVPGFRKGKAPDNMLKGKIDQTKVLDNAINNLLPIIYEEVLTEEKIEPFARPNVDVTKVNLKELEVKFVIPTYPTVSLGKYKALAIGKEEVKITAKDVTEEINKTLKNNASLVLKDGVAAKGDTVVLDFVGKVDGVAFEGGSANNYELELGSNTFIPGFEDQLVGTKAEEKKDVNVTFPENYTAELKGKKAVFECTIHEIKTKKLPELNDEFVGEQNIKGVKTVDEYKAHVKEDLTKRKEADVKNAYIDKLLDTIAKDSKIEIPEEAIKNQTASRKQEVVAQMKQSGLTYDQYLSFVGQTDEQFTKNLDEQSRKSIVNFLVINEVAKLEKIEVSDKEFDDSIKSLADQYKMKVEDVKAALGNNLHTYKDRILEDKVFNFLLKENN